jgi:hypothetical protein
MDIEKVMKDFSKFVNKHGLCMYQCPCEHYENTEVGCKWLENVKDQAIRIKQLYEDLKKGK